MKTRSKKEYTTPNMELISLDNEISLALESTPPIGPGELFLGASTSDNFVADPFDTAIGTL